MNKKLSGGQKLKSNTAKSLREFLQSVDLSTIDSEAELQSYFSAMKEGHSAIVERFQVTAGLTCGFNAPKWAGGDKDATLPEPDMLKAYWKRLIAVCRESER